MYADLNNTPSTRASSARSRSARHEFFINIFPTTAVNRVDCCANQGRFFPRFCPPTLPSSSSDVPSYWDIVILSTRDRKEQEAVEEHDGSHTLRLTCQKCGKYIKSAAYLRNHIKKVHGKKYQCEICRVKINSMN